MTFLEIQKPTKRNKSHLKALIYHNLFLLGYDVWIDVSSNALVKYTAGLKGYAKTKFDIVIYSKDKAIGIVMVSPTSRRFTKSKFYGIPVIVINHEKYEPNKALEEIKNKLSQ